MISFISEFTRRIAATLIFFQGAPSDCEDENGCTPIMFAAMRNHPGSVPRLNLMSCSIFWTIVGGTPTLSFHISGPVKTVQWSDIDCERFPALRQRAPAPRRRRHTHQHQRRVSRGTRRQLPIHSGSGKEIVVFHDTIFNLYSTCIQLR